MSEVERLCWENAERRRFAEEVDQKMARQERAEQKETELKMWRKWAKGCRIGGRVHLVLSAVLALMGLPVWAVMGSVAAALYYTCAGMFQRWGCQNG